MKQEINLINISQERVKDLIKKNNLTQKEFCDICDISTAKLCRFLKNGKMLNITEFVNIAEKFNTSVIYLFGLYEDIGDGKYVKKEN